MFHGWIFGVTNIPLDSWEGRVRFSICSLSPKIMVEDETGFRRVSLKSTCCWNIGLWSLSVGTIALVASTKSAFLETFYIAEQNTNAWTSRADCCRSGDFCCLQYPTYQAFEANGVWILEKVFDIGCNLVDVLLVYENSIPISGREVRPGDYLIELVRILRTVFGGNSKCLGFLSAKANSLSSRPDQGRIRWVWEV